jgi:hypothetical protein
MDAGPEAHVVYLAASNVRQAWCDTCQKPSAVAADVVTLDDDGVSVVADTSTCSDCEPTPTQTDR